LALEIREVLRELPMPKNMGQAAVWVTVFHLVLTVEVLNRFPNLIIPETKRVL
jgi:hypothetical protein